MTAAKMGEMFALNEDEGSNWDVLIELGAVDEYAVLTLADIYGSY